MQKIHPSIIQGGMGIGVSNWRLAQTVSRLGELGVVSGTCMNTVLIRRLQDGDADGSCRRALAHFPAPGVAEELIKTYYVEGGKKADVPYKRSPVFAIKSSLGLLRLTVAANFVEVFLAKEGHGGVVGLNLLEKIQLPNLPSIYGAMLAGVDYVLMGAGIPREMPGALDKLALHEEASHRLAVDDAAAEDDNRILFDPKTVFPNLNLAPLKRPDFLAIVASSTLALSLAKKSTGKVNGFIIEHWTAGGHNAPPRGPMRFNECGEPLYTERDIVDLSTFRDLGLPFWLAGSAATPDKFVEALSFGATGVQVGTAFAFCNESGLDSDLKNSVRQDIVQNQAPSVFTDPLASPSGFPFKVVQRAGTLSDEAVYQERPRKCDLGYLRTAYKNDKGGIGMRCPAEPIDDYLKKGGKIEDTKGRKCLCNGLFSVIGMPQSQESGYQEAAIMTAGDDVSNLRRLFKPGSNSYSAADVIHYLRLKIAQP
ncbi:MAG: nitronate monooxygenase, partial [Bdellovibrionales bacterium]